MFGIKRKHSIKFKLTIVYILLAIVNVSFFSILIYENQVDLIIQNEKLQLNEQINELTSQLYIQSDILQIKLLQDNTISKKSIKNYTQVIRNLYKNFIIFNTKGKVLYKYNYKEPVAKQDILNGITAISNKNYIGKRFFSYSYKKSKYTNIYFYIPLKLSGGSDSILLVTNKIHNIKFALEKLYKILIIFLSVIIIAHYFIWLFLFRLFVKPIEALYGQSKEVSKGNLKSRVSINSNDELGELGNTFNNMVQTIEDKITTMEKFTQEVEFELDIAKEVQKSIYPKIADNKYFTTSVFSQSLGKVCGDYYDYFQFDEDNAGMVIADISGHGIPASLITMLSKEAFNNFAYAEKQPSDVLRKVNETITHILLKNEDTNLLLTYMYLSAFYITFYKNKTIHFSNAGHVKPILIKPLQKTIEHIDSKGFLIGFNRDAGELFESASETVSSKDKIVFYTDGITEMQNNEEHQYGLANLKKTIHNNIHLNAADLKDAILNDIFSFAGSQSFTDDTTLIVIEFT